MASQAAIVHTMVGALREDLQTVIAAPADRGLAEAARVRLVDIGEMAGRPASVMRATRRVSRAVDHIVGTRDEGRAERAVGSLKHSLAELSAAVHRLP